MKLSFYLPRFLKLSLLLILPLLFSACGKTRRVVQPHYRFELSHISRYNVLGQLTIGVNAGLVNFNGKINLSAILELKAESTNSLYGTFLRVNIKDVNVSGVSGKIKGIVLTYINYIRILFSGMYISDTGRVTVFYKNQPHSGLSSYGQMVFPDFSDMTALWDGQSINTNFNGRFQKQAVTIGISINSSVVGISSPNIHIQHNIEIATYDQKEFEKSSDPQRWGTFSAELNDTFNYIDGVLTQKTGDFNFDMSVPIRQGFLSYVISVQGSGTLKMQEIAQPVL